jgi:hypothetical protein
VVRPVDILQSSLSVSTGPVLWLPDRDGRTTEIRNQYQSIDLERQRTAEAVTALLNTETVPVPSNPAGPRNKLMDGRCKVVVVRQSAVGLCKTTRSHKDPRNPGHRPGLSQRIGLQPADRQTDTTRKPHMAPLYSATKLGGGQAVEKCWRLPFPRDGDMGKEGPQSTDDSGVPLPDMQVGAL